MKKLLFSLVFILSLGGIVIDGFQPCIYASEKTSKTPKKKSQSGRNRTTSPTTKTNSVSSTAESRGPGWINGTWVYKGNVTTSLGTMYTNCALSINRNNQTLVCVSGRDIVEKGYYEVYDGAIHCGSMYWDLDESNHRIGLGEGVYMYKQ